MIKKYFARANTSSGLVDLSSENLTGVDNVYVISGKSGNAKSRVLEMAARHIELKGEDAELIKSPFNAAQYDGIIIRGRGFAAVDADCSVKNVCDTVDTDRFVKVRDEIRTAQLLRETEWAYGELYRAYGEAKIIHDEWEKLYNAKMDFNRLSGYGDGVINQVIKRVNDSRNNNITERFFGASTKDGAVNYIDCLTAGIKRRCFIKGRPGTGKSTFLKKLVKAAEISGYSAEVYYCSFDKNSLDMVVIPELSFCAFDSTPPHEMFPSAEGDEILDFYEEAGLCGVDDELTAELGDVKRRYDFKIAEGKLFLGLGQVYSMEREHFFDIDSDGLSVLADDLVRKIYR